VTIAAASLAAAAAAMLIGYLVLRPPLGPAVRLWLLVAAGLLPLGAALTGNLANFERTKQRSFCASCHPMEPYVATSEAPESAALAATHSRNRAFGEESCYVCHRDYGMFGTVTTRLGGLRHAWAFYVGGWSEPPRLYHPYSNEGCRFCHSTTLPGFGAEPEHAIALEELARDEISCVASGCHGPAHPLGAESGR
jgi:hypothetical protein